MAFLLSANTAEYVKFFRGCDGDVKLTATSNRVVLCRKIEGNLIIDKGFDGERVHHFGTEKVGNAERKKVEYRGAFFEHAYRIFQFFGQFFCGEGVADGQFPNLLEVTGNVFMAKNDSVEKIILPKLTTVGGNFFVSSGDQT